MNGMDTDRKSFLPAPKESRLMSKIESQQQQSQTSVFFSYLVVPLSITDPSCRTRGCLVEFSDIGLPTQNNCGVTPTEITKCSFKTPGVGKCHNQYDFSLYTYKI